MLFSRVNQATRCATTSSNIWTDVICHYSTDYHGPAIKQAISRAILLMLWWSGTACFVFFRCSQILTRQQYKSTLIFPRFAHWNYMTPSFHFCSAHGGWMERLFNFERRYSMKTPPEIKLCRGVAAAKKPNARRLLRVYWFSKARKRDWIKKNRNNRWLKNNRAPATRIKGTQRCTWR